MLLLQSLLVHFALFCCICWMAAGQDASNSVARILLFSATRGYRHDSIPTAIRRLKERGPTSSPKIVFEDTEDPSQFNDSNLSKYDAIVFLLTTGEVLDESGKQAFQTYLNRGGNFVGIHSASDTINQTDFFREELGAFFDYHPDIQEGVVLVLDKNHPSTSMLPERWTVRDEFYNFKSDPRDVGASVILSVDESSYTDSGNRRFDQGSPHPIAWYQNQGAGASSLDVAGRSWYTSLGHLNETWETDPYVDHVMGGITWALGSNKTRVFNSTATVGSADGSSGQSSGSGSTPRSTTSPSSSTAGSNSNSGTTNTAAGVFPSLFTLLSFLFTAFC